MSSKSVNDDSILSNCAACGKIGDGLKRCNACKLVKYCGVECQRAHRPQHKKECKKRAAERHDEALFKQPPPRDECLICMLTLPLRADKSQYQSCCGKTVCNGCMYGLVNMAVAVEDINRCPFCRAPPPNSDAEIFKRTKKRADMDLDPVAISQLASFYREGSMGLPQDINKAIELYIQAGKLGYASSYYSIGYYYHAGEIVEKDETKAKHYFELAAMGGVVFARHNLGAYERDEGNKTRAAKHYLISAGAGYDDSLNHVRRYFMRGLVTKDEFERVLRAHMEAKDEMESDQRKAAALFDAMQMDGHQ